MHANAATRATLRRTVAWLVLGLGGCSHEHWVDQPGRTTLNQEHARLQALLERSLFTLTQEEAGLHVVTSPCFAQSGIVYNTEFRLRAGDTFASEPDHHINTAFELLESGSGHARFGYVHRHDPPGPASDRTEDRGEIVLPYRQRDRFFPTQETARAAAIDALRRVTPLAELDVDRAMVFLDRVACTGWSVRVPVRAGAASKPPPAPAGGAWIVRLDMTTGASTANRDD